MFGSLQREKKIKVKRCICQSKREVQEQFGRKINQDVNGNGKLFWKEVSKVNGRKVENFNRIKDGNGRLAQGEDEVRKIWKEYFEDLYNIYNQEQVALNICSFDGIRGSNCFGREPIVRACVRVKGGESEFFRINSGVRKGCIISPWMKEVKMGMGRRGVRFQEEGRECRLSDLLYADDLILRGKI